MEKKISVIVAAFNAEKTIARCIQSILDQDYTNFELLIIDDGSEDETSKIALDFSNKDKRVHVFEQKNSGVSAARNAGLKRAQGEYIQFVDSDDEIHPGMMKFLVQKMEKEKAELVISGFVYRKRDEGKDIPFLANSDIYPDKTLNIRLFLSNIGFYLLYFNTISMMCNKLFQAKIIKEKKLFFDEKMYYGEDFVFNLKYLNYCHAVCITNKLLYYYCIDREDSLERRYKPDVFEQLFCQFKVLAETLNKWQIVSKLNQRNISTFILSRTIYGLDMLFSDAASEAKEEKKKILKEICRNSYVKEAIRICNVSFGEKWDYVLFLIYKDKEKEVLERLSQSDKHIPVKVMPKPIGKIIGFYAFFRLYGLRIFWMKFIKRKERA